MTESLLFAECTFIAGRPSLLSRFTPRISHQSSIAPSFSPFQSRPALNELCTLR